MDGVMDVGYVISKVWSFVKINKCHIYIYIYIYMNWLRYIGRGAKIEKDIEPWIRR